MPSEVWSMRMTPETRKRLRWLHGYLNVSYSELVTRAVVVMYDQAREVHDERLAMRERKGDDE